jgi:exopolysaccharide biosynthesis polyprenyl glycosylphosphotransferase
MHLEVASVWEVLPRGHVEFGARATILRRDALLRRSLALVDVIAAIGALAIVVSAIHAGAARLAPSTILLVPIVLVAGKVIGLYDRDQHVVHKTTIDEAPSLLCLSVVYALTVWLCEAVVLRGYLFRADVFALLLTTFVLVSAGRLLVRRLTLRLIAAERCIVLGGADDAARVAVKFEASSAVNAVVVGRVGLRPGDQGPDGAHAVPTLGGYDSLTRVVAEHDVERAIIAPRSDGQEEILDAIRLIKALGIKVSVLPRLLEVVGSSSTFDEVDGIWLLGVRQYGLARSSELLKRGMDIAAVLFGVALLAPAFAAIMVAIKLDSPGPAFFGQPRIGYRGDRFWMLKFRSMVVDAEARRDELHTLNEVEGGLFKITRDPRVTRVGRMLRRTSLDELPQLLNVLRGDMSLVGPRPLIPDEDALIEGWRRRRLAVKPGMTGLWQIFGSYRIPMQEMVKIDYIYGANWSLWLDLRILLRTIPYVLNRRGL